MAVYQFGLYLFEQIERYRVQEKELSSEVYGLNNLLIERNPIRHSLA